jgi:hypothetical protein
VEDCLRTMAYKVRTKQYLLEQNNRELDNYIPQIYVKLKGWNPPRATLDVENRLTDFEKQIRTATHSNKLQKYNFTDLTHPQQQALNSLKHNKEFIIIPADKNLGPAIMKCDEYIKQCLSEHLLTTNYNQLSNQAADTRVESVKSLLKKYFNSYKNQPSHPEITYFTRSF